MFGYDLAYGFQIGNIEIGRLYAVYVVDVGEDVAVRTALSDDAYFVAELTVGSRYKDCFMLCKLRIKIYAIVEWRVEIF